MMIPALIACFQSSGVSSLVATHLALGTALLVYTCIAAVGVVRSLQDSRLRELPAFVLSAGGVLGAVGGAFAAGMMLGRTMQRIFAAFLVLAVTQVIGTMKKARTEMEAVGFRLFVTGIAGGIVASWTGAGGEAVFQRSLYSYLGFSLKKAHATAALGMAGTALAGAAAYAVVGRGESLLPAGTVGFVGALEAVPVIVGFLATDRLGMLVAERAKPVLRKFYAVILLVVAARMFLV